MRFGLTREIDRHIDNRRWNRDSVRSGGSLETCKRSYVVFIRDCEEVLANGDLPK